MDMGFVRAGSTHQDEVMGLLSELTRAKWFNLGLGDFLIVLRDNPVVRATDRMLRPSTRTQRRIFDTLSINNTCSFLRT